MDFILISVLVFTIFHHFTSAGYACNGIDIKHEKDLHKLQDCTIVVGHISLSNFRLSDNREIVSHLEEVTDYILVYRVEGLETLEYIFPNLSVIRGHQLLFDKYSLVVYENRNVRSLGLKSLLKIRQGSILIESNPVLCFVDTVNWVYIVENHLTQHFSLKNNQDSNECAVCLKNVNNSDTEYLTASCWDIKNVQRRKLTPHFSDCLEECGTNGCTTDRICCSPLCLTGCSAENCRICKDFKTLQGNCVENCNFPYFILADQCITEKECYQKGLIPHTGFCTSKCPRSYKKIIVNGQAQCSVLCEGNFTIRSKDDLDDLRDCVSIQGSLRIDLRDDRSEIVAELENALGAITEISGSLTITRSPQLVSLGFFKKLDTIKGEELIDKEIAFYVVDNFHLEEIWPPNHKVAILRGRLFFHLNPRLCFDKILELVPSIRGLDELTARDASRNSNGERVICGDRVHLIKPTVVDVNATAALIKVKALSSFEKDVVLGYLHYYKEAPAKNMTRFDGRHGCGLDSWRMDMTLNRNVRHILFNLKPYTQYAFFVKTFTVVNYHMAMDWYSDIQYFTTTAMKPGPVQKISTTPFTAKSIIVHWWPPKDSNGIIEKYLLRFEERETKPEETEVNAKGHIREKDKHCECGFLKDNQTNRGPPPDDLKYYNMNQNIMDEAITNLIYISAETIRRLQEKRRIEDSTRRKRETTNSTQESLNITQTVASEAKTNSSSEEKFGNDDVDDTAILFRKHIQEVERKAFLQQDTGPAGFLIEPLTPICSVTNPSKKFKDNHKCTELEHYEGIEIPGETHSYVLENLEFSTAYSIYIRACVKGLENACGPERSIDVKTVSKSMENFLNDA